MVSNTPLHTVPKKDRARLTRKCLETHPALTLYICTVLEDSKNSGIRNFTISLTFERRPLSTSSSTRTCLFVLRHPQGFLNHAETFGLFHYYKIGRGTLASYAIHFFFYNFRLKLFFLLNFHLRYFRRYFTSKLCRLKTIWRKYLIFFPHLFKICNYKYQISLLNICNYDRPRTSYIRTYFQHILEKKNVKRWYQEVLVIKSVLYFFQYTF